MIKILLSFLLGFIFLNTPFANAEVTASQLNTALYRIKENPEDSIAVKASLTLTAQYFNENGIEYKEGTKEGFPVLIISQTKSSKINKLALRVFDRFDGLTILFNPVQIGARFPSKGFYDTDDHTISVGGAMDTVINLRNPTFFHELLHGILSTKIYRQGAESVYGLVLAKKNATMLDLLVNPYAQLFTVQELATHAFELKLSLVRLNNESDDKKKALIINNIKNAATASMLISRSLVTELTNFEAGVNKGQYEIAKDEAKFGGGISSHYVIRDNNQELYMALSPQIKESDVRKKIGEQLKEYVVFAKEYKELAEQVAEAVSKDNIIPAKAKYRKTQSPVKAALSESAALL